MTRPALRDATVVAVRGRRIGRAAVARVVKVLRDGGVVVFPTDTVYGLAASVFQPRAIQKVYRLKGRSYKKPLPFLVASLKDALALVEPPDRRLRGLLREYWPGPLTVVFNTSPLGRWTAGGKDTLAVRVPDHPVTLAILRALGQPLAVTSANRSGRREAVTGEEARRLFEGKVDLVVDAGACPGGQASTVLNVASTAWTLARPGPVSKEQILKHLEQ